jgi:hypothetical protein
MFPNECLPLSFGLEFAFPVGDQKLAGRFSTPAWSRFMLPETPVPLSNYKRDIIYHSEVLKLDGDHME